LGKITGDLEHLADQIGLSDLQSLSKDLELLHAGKSTLDMDTKASDVGGVLAIHINTNFGAKISDREAAVYPTNGSAKRAPETHFGGGTPACMPVLAIYDSAWMKLKQARASMHQCKARLLRRRPSDGVLGE
jgi:hypothetical protein